MRKVVAMLAGALMIVGASACGDDSSGGDTTDRVRNAAPTMVWSPLVVNSELDPAKFGGVSLVSAHCPSTVWCFAMLNSKVGKPLIVEQQRSSETQRFDPAGWKLRVIEPGSSSLVIQSVSCGTPSQCVLVGRLGEAVATVVGSFGAWGAPVPVADPKGVTTGSATVLSSCTNATQACVIAGVAFTDINNRDPHLFVINSVPGTVGTANLAWGEPIRTNDPAIGWDAHIKSINCSLGSCAAVVLSQPVSSTVRSEGGDDRLVRFEVTPGQGVSNLKDAGLGYVNWTSGVTCPKVDPAGAAATIGQCMVMAGSTPLTPGTTPTSGKSVVSGFRWDGQPVKVTRQVISGSIQCAPNGSCLGISGPTDGGYLQGNNWQSQTIVANSWFDPVAGIDIKTSPTSINGKSAYFSAMTCPADRFCMMVGWSGTTSSSKVAAQGVSLPFNGSPATFFPPVEPAGQEGVMSVQQPRVACATGQSCMLAAMVTVKDSTGATVVRLAGSQWAPAGT